MVTTQVMFASLAQREEIWFNFRISPKSELLFFSLYEQSKNKLSKCIFQIIDFQCITNIKIKIFIKNINFDNGLKAVPYLCTWKL
jgi:hypothetical protein